MTNIRKLFASNMKMYRKKRGVSQEKLAEQINSASNYISNIEKCAQFPSTDMIEKIAAALGIDTLELFSLTPPSADSIDEFCAAMQEGIQRLAKEKLKELESRLR